MAPLSAGYKPTARAIHWIVAIMVLAMLPIGTLMTQEDLARGMQNTLYVLHKNGGVIVLVLMILRLGYRLANPPPSLAGHYARLAGAGRRADAFPALFHAVLHGADRVRPGSGRRLSDRDPQCAWAARPFIPLSDSLESIAQTAHFYGRYGLIVVVRAAYRGGAAAWPYQEGWCLHADVADRSAQLTFAHSGR